jgi:F-type H+-transporting ATPase subunit b
VLAAPLWAEEEATGLAALGVDLTSLLVYLVNFGVLLVILYLVGYKRILGMMDQRSLRIKDSLEEADRVRQEAQERQTEMQRTLDEGRQESQRVLAEAREMAERFRQEEMERARSEATGLLGRARAEIQQERDTAVDQVRQEFASLAVTAAERIIHQSLDAQIHQDLINEVLEEGDALRGGGG